ncbi:TetR/AcrR family transcriptional regulator [Alicyclobacillus tolerans]|uniref:AcrR family transcriptional regulator n=2 Tax=Alicyclobacillus tolerans TaxID=90970 RepID=A0ABT9LTF4_9BACL|nr:MULTISPECIES: TetR/AcrR family transcriptional regulator [Alicyclobacillus]MDP9727533.1 AcrR family transcriptional regulator [Alicyclobacillus tengchongensis]QRF23971.1 TetR/AcrR family transcriptional regulator [Alicyclobacillus sp. TC]SHJ67900.1 transcriptional regulator, TetR family [Alicyclobacillus montanus]
MTTLALQIGTQVKDPERVRLRREQIVHAAVELFIQKGFHRTTTREIAKASGLSNGALYEYVETKEDILFLVCRHIHQEVRNRLADCLRLPGCGAEKLRQALYSFCEVMVAMQDEILLIYQESKALPKVYLREVLAEEQMVVGIFEKLLYEGIEDGSIQLPADRVSILAQDAVAMGEMIAFRRWALRAFEGPTLLATQVDLILRAAGVSP